MLEISVPAPQLIASAAVLTHWNNKIFFSGHLTTEHHYPSFTSNLQMKYPSNNNPLSLHNCRVLNHLACSSGPRLAKNDKGVGAEL